MNDADSLLAELHPLEIPGVSSVPALGWWIVLLIAVGSIVVFWLTLWRYRRRVWLRDAKNELEALRNQPMDTDAREFLSVLSGLLRRVLIKRESRASVAALQGDDWLARLDALLGDNVFQSDLGPLLSEGPYRRTTDMSQDDREALISATAKLIRRAGSSNV